MLGTHHGGQSHKHLQRYLGEFVFRFNRRKAKSISHRFAKLIRGPAAPHGMGRASCSFSVLPVSLSTSIRRTR